MTDSISDKFTVSAAQRDMLSDIMADLMSSKRLSSHILFESFVGKLQEKLGLPPKKFIDHFVIEDIVAKCPILENIIGNDSAIRRNFPASEGELALRLMNECGTVAKGDMMARAAVPTALRTDSCSTADTRTRGRPQQRSAMAFASVAPLVKTTCSGLAPTAPATSRRASSITARALRP